MSVPAEFVGGPWDGRVEALEEALVEVYVPMPLPVGPIDPDREPTPIRLGVYRVRPGRRRGIAKLDWLGIR